MEGAVQPIPETIEDLKRTQAQFIESLKLADADRQRQMMEWQETLETQFSLIDDQRQRFNEMMALKDEIRRTLLELEKFREGLQREQEQVAALQRLAEERMKKDMESFLADNEKRWKKQLLDWQYRWDKQEQLNTAINNRFPVIQRRLQQEEDLLQMLWSLLDEQSRVELRSAQQWMSQIQRSSEEREAIFRKYKETEQAD
jgi:hypothetical protein